MMEITAEMLSKDILVKLVKHMKTEGFLEPGAIPAFYKVDLEIQLRKMKDSLDDIDKKLDSKRLSLKEGNTLVRKYNQIGSLAKKKIKLLEELEKEAK